MVLRTMNVTVLSVGASGDSIAVPILVANTPYSPSPRYLAVMLVAPLWGRVEKSVLGLLTSMEGEGEGIQQADEWMTPTTTTTYKAVKLVTLDGLAHGHEARVPVLC